MMTSIKKYMAACGLLAGLVFGSCEDNLTSVGTTIQPPGDLITVFTDTFTMTASTVRLDSVFAKTTECMLGEMYDPLYGMIKSDFLCQFYCEEGFEFAETPYEGRIDSVDLFIVYPNTPNNRISAYGDTLLPMQVSVYPVEVPLSRNFYTNDDPETYCDMNNPLGMAAYTPYDMSVPDSIRNVTDSYGYSTYTPNIRVRLPRELGQKMYDETVNNPSTFADQNSFNQFFPGVYVTNTFGSGNLIYTRGENISIRISYHVMEKGSSGQDTAVYRSQWFYSAKDVVQINRFKNSNMDQLLEETPTHTYIKAPAGVCTKLVIPTTQISNEMDVEDRFINSFTLDLKYLPEEERDFAYTPPSHLLILPEDSAKAFFENGSIENNITSFVSYMYLVDENNSMTSAASSNFGYNPNTRTYSFGNISNLLKTHMEKSPEKDLNVLVIPVNRGFTTSSSTYYTTSISNALIPSGVKIRKEEEFMKIVILSSKFDNKDN